MNQLTVKIQGFLATSQQGFGNCLQVVGMVNGMQNNCKLITTQTRNKVLMPKDCPKRFAISFKTASPARWPYSSLMALNLLLSMNNKAELWRYCGFSKIMTIGHTCQLVVMNLK